MEKPLIEITPELQKSVLNKFEVRADTLELKGKKRQSAQIEFLIGAVSIIDSINDNNKTAIPPNWLFDIMRGDYVTNKD
jgi:hypothetical protein